MEIKYEELVLLNIMRDEKLLPLQFAVKEKLNKNSYAFVFDEVGCGKTIEAGICIWDNLIKGGKNVLIVAPSNLTFNWYTEMLTKFGMDFKIIGGTKDSIDLYYNDQNKEIINGVAHLCIVSYDSRNGDASNAAIDRICKKNITWDLIVLDEGHESKNNSSVRYKSLAGYRSKKVLFLSATPIKNLQEDFVNEFDLVKQIVGKNDEELEINPDRSISFDLSYPISRNFKEIVADRGEFKKRIVSEINYEIKSDIEKALRNDGLAFDQKRNCIMLFENYLRNDFSDIFSRYHRRIYDKEDVSVLREFDSKLDALLVKIEEISKDDRIVIFCNHIAVIDYLKKVLTSLYGVQSIEAIHGENYEQEERKKRLLLLDKTDAEMDQKRVVILSHNIASVGVNLSKFTHLINYELPYTPADLEQRFGRIDRITNDSEKLMLYFFKDKNRRFDTVYLNRIFTKLTWQVLPLLPGKNLISTVTDAVVNGYSEEFRVLLDIEQYLKTIEDNGAIEEDERLNLIKERFGKRIVESASGKIQKSSMEDILSGIQGLRKQWKINEEDKEDVLRTKVRSYLESMENKVFYEVNGQKQGISYKELRERVYTPEYQIFSNEINEKRRCIIEKATQVSEQYKQDKKNFLDAIRNYLNEKDDVAFVVLYGIYCALKKNEIEIKFDQLIREYNGE